MTKSFFDLRKELVKEIGKADQATLESLAWHLKTLEAVKKEKIRENN